MKILFEAKLFGMAFMAIVESSNIWTSVFQMAPGVAAPASFPFYFSPIFFEMALLGLPQYPSFGGADSGWRRLYSFFPSIFDSNFPFFY